MAAVLDAIVNRGCMKSDNLVRFFVKNINP
jgi:hypothetical protein